jgi:prepilin-type processing-associated H-X9-DG protein
LLAHVFPGPVALNFEDDGTRMGLTQDGTQNARDGTGVGSGYVGSPHPSAHPFLFADGHVQAVPYSWSPPAGATLTVLWDYTNTTPFSLP